MLRIFLLIGVAVSAVVTSCIPHAPVTVVAYGDSYTNPWHYGTYVRAPLVWEGVPSDGWNCPGIVDVLLGDLAALESGEQLADMVVIQCGINDAGHPNTTLENVETKLREGVLAIQATGSLAMLVGPGPRFQWDRCADPEPCWNLLAGINAVHASVAADLGAGYANWRKTMLTFWGGPLEAEQACYQDDGLHPDPSANGNCGRILAFEFTTAAWEFVMQSERATE